MNIDQGIQHQCFINSASSLDKRKENSFERIWGIIIKIIGLVKYCPIFQWHG